MKLINKKGTFVKDENSSFKIMRNLFIALLPIILFAFYKNGYVPYSDDKVGVSGLFYPLIFMIIPAFTSFIAELIWIRFVSKNKGYDLVTSLKSSFSIFPGLFLGLILPMNTPLSIVILGAIFATIIGKLVYGGFGKNIFNPALVGRIFIISTYALSITNNGGYLNPSELDAVTKSTPLSNIVEGIGTYDTLVKPYGSLLDFFVGTIPGAMGETSALLCLIGLIYLLFKKVIKPIIPFTYIITVFLMTFVIGSLNGLGLWYPLFQILSGGLMFGAVFMATDPVTSPVTKIGQVIFGLSLGFLTVVFRFLTPFPEGVLTSILTMNMLVVILDRIGLKAKFDKKYLYIPIVIIILLISSISIYISKSFDKVNTDFNIISKNKDNNITTYVVTQKGYSSTLKAEVKLEEERVLSYKILEQNDSFYQRIESTNYLDKLLNNQYALDKMDTVSGATITSTALKQMLINTINDYTNNKGFSVKEDIKEEEKYKIISKEETEFGTIYEVEGQSFGGKMVLLFTTSLNRITNIEVKSHNDSYLNMVIDNNYLDTVITNQDIVKDLDSIAGATYSSTAIKEMTSLVMGDLNEEV